MKKLVDSFKQGGDKRKPRVEWTVEQTKDVPTVHGTEPIHIERTLRDEASGIRNIRLRRGYKTISFDIESAELIAFMIKEVAQGYVPEVLSEESIKKSGE